MDINSTNDIISMLSDALQNGIIDLTDVREKVEMNNRTQILAKHKYSIKQGKDGLWRTRVPDSTKKDGRKMIKKQTKEDVENAVIAYYRELENKASITFDDAYWKWRESQDQLVQDNSVVKYNTDYERFFKGTAFSQKTISKITEEDIKVFIHNTIKGLSLCKSATKSLFGYVRRTMESALINEYIQKAPMASLEAKQFYKYCTASSRSLKPKVINGNEMKELNHRFYQDHQEKPEYIPTYAVELASLTGMRAGELAGLRWNKVFDDYLLIDTSEKYNRKTKQYYIDTTKNQKVRKFPITPQIRELLETVKHIESENGFLCEWVFANENGRLHAPVISSCAKNKCRQIGLDDKGIQAYRRTVNSRMRHNGVPRITTSSLLGHTEEVNEQYYTFDMSTMDEKMKIVSIINQEVKDCF